MFLPGEKFRKLPGLPVHELTDIMTIKKKRKKRSLNGDCVGAQKSGTLPQKTMVIVHDYWLDGKTSKGIFYVRSREIQRCPICGSELTVSGSRRRGLVEESGEKKILKIRRLWCDRCSRLHHELPDIIVPYKRYSSETIENILSEKAEHADSCPCELSTEKRIKLWFFLLREYFESAMEAIKALYDYDKEIAAVTSRLLPLSEHHHFPAGWLKTLVRLLVNSNRWIHTRSA